MLEPVGILGYGRFGRALAELVIDAGGRVTAWDPSPHVEIPDAMRAASTVAAVRDVTWVVPAVPVGALADVLAAVRPALNPNQLVIDVASVQHAAVAALRETLGADVPWIATHPLFGPTSIALGERPLTVVVCPNPAQADAAARATSFWKALGCTVVTQDADEHDRLMARTHALTFFVAKGLLDLGLGEPLPVTPPSFHAIARTLDEVRSDASHLFRTIQNDNPFAAAERERLLDALAAIHEELAAAFDPAVARPAPRLDLPDLGERAADLKETRELIDELDRELVHLLGRRLHLARRAGRAKAGAGQPVRDAEREAALLDARRAWAELEGLDGEMVTRVFERILREARRMQREAPP